MTKFGFTGSNIKLYWGTE